MPVPPHGSTCRRWAGRVLAQYQCAGWGCRREILYFQALTSTPQMPITYNYDRPGSLHLYYFRYLMITECNLGSHVKRSMPIRVSLHRLSLVNVETDRVHLSIVGHPHFLAVCSVCVHKSVLAPFMAGAGEGRLSRMMIQRWFWHFLNSFLRSSNPVGSQCNMVVLFLTGFLPFILPSLAALLPSFALTCT